MRGKSDILRIPDRRYRLRALVQEQRPVRRRLLNHLCVQVVPLRPFRLVVVVRVDNYAGKVGRLAFAGVRDGSDGDGDGSKGDKEAALVYTWSASTHIAKGTSTNAERLVGGAVVVRTVGFGRGVFGGLDAGGIPPALPLCLRAQEPRGAYCCSLERLHAWCEGQWVTGAGT